MRRGFPLARIILRTVQRITLTIGSQCARTCFSREEQVGIGTDNRKMHEFPIESMRFTKARAHVELCRRGESGCHQVGQRGILLRSPLPWAARAAHANPGWAAAKPSQKTRKTNVFIMMSHHNKSVCFIRFSVISMFHLCAKRTE